ncbi:MAG: PorV/PorQ family protein [Sphingobacteriales bacterium]|nr:MAG: PorV/PorQ family protein [Sphingobacteriales bacterium]
MRNYLNKAALVVCALGLSVSAFAGNKDRTGQAGATELLINPWGQSTGLFGMNTSYVKGLESMKSNIAGLAFVKNTEIGLAHSVYLRGSNVSINNLGLAQKIGNLGVLGFNIMSVGFGDITITDFNNPEGGIGTYKPQFLNIQLGFGKEFVKGVYGGIGATFVSQQINSVRASGAAFEAGIQYITGKRDNFHFGVTLRNVGTNMRFSGSGFALNAENPGNENQQMNLQVPTEKFEMPTYLNFGISYDFFLDEKRLKSTDDVPQHRATVMANFTSNSFNNDYLGGGLEYAYRETFMLRGAYRYEQGIGSRETSNTFYTGLAAGATIQKSLGENGPTLALDYSYRPTARPNNGVHTFSLRFMTAPKSKKDASGADSE